MALDFLDAKPIKRGNKHWPYQIRKRSRYLREVEGLTFPEIAKEMEVPQRTVETWAYREVWKTKGETAVEVEEFTRKRFLELASANGMPKTRAIQLLIDGMTKPAEIIKDEQGAVLASDPDYNARHKYQKEYWDIVGLKGSGKGMEIANNGSGSVNIQVNIPEKNQLLDSQRT